MGLQFIMTEDHANELRAQLKQAKAVALEAVGQQAEGDVASITPVDTGRLKGSITHRRQGDNAVVIGTNVEYATYVEMGTSKTRAQPYLRPAITSNASVYRDIIKTYLSGK